MSLAPSRRRILREVIAAERQGLLLLRRAEALSSRPDEREFYRRLAAREREVLEQLQGREQRREDDYSLPKALEL